LYLYLDTFSLEYLVSVSEIHLWLCISIYLKYISKVSYPALAVRSIAR